MRDERTVPMGQNPWSDYDAEEPGKTVVDGSGSTVPMDGGAGYQGGGRAAPYAGGYEKTVADDGPFQRTHPQDRPTPTGRVGGGDFPRYDPPPYQQQPFGGYGAPAGGESKTVIMPSGVPETLPLAWLAVVEGPGAPRGQVFPLGSDTVLGRTAENHIALSGDRAVSSRHLKIKLEADAENPEKKVFVMYDQGSANGTYAGDYQACKAAENRVYRHVLGDGDFFLIGETLLVFKSVDVK